MNAIMDFKFSWFGEPFFTYWTFVRLFPSVGMVVSFEDLGFRKSFLAYFAHIRLFSCMYPIMDL
jgi:hypothetical protein